MVDENNDNSNLCASCTDPGHCCRDFPLSGIYVEDHPTKLDAMIWAASTTYEIGEDHTRTGLGFPFVPLYVSGDVPEFQSWRWACVNLLPNGRCGDYDNRPYGPCVIFEPGSDDPLCVMRSEAKNVDDG